jgi:hypothetical protein
VYLKKGVVLRDIRENSSVESFRARDRKCVGAMLIHFLLVVLSALRTTYEQFCNDPQLINTSGIARRRFFR